MDAVLAALHNDFESVLFARYPELDEIKARLIAAGARGALLSGTGSALFGIFETDTARTSALAELSRTRLARAGQWRVWPCESLSSHAYESEA
jgi:4-diphosphocytidyl-2C-methyl-D-erythritol kinase